MAKENVRAIVPESKQTFDDALSSVKSVIAAEVPITAEDKTGARASDTELSKLDFIVNNVAKVDQDMPKNFDNNVYADNQSLLKEKQRQVTELKQLTADAENQVAVVKIRIKKDIMVFYSASKVATKRDSSLKYIEANIQQCYERKSNNDNNNGDSGTDKPSDTPK
jgi:hypothetical protein